MSTGEISLDQGSGSNRQSYAATEETKLIPPPVPKNETAFTPLSPPPPKPEEKLSFWDRLKKAKRESSSACAFCFGVFLLIVTSVVTSAIMLVSLAIPVSMLWMGTKYIDDCKAEKMIPIYLVVAGSVGSTKIVCNLFDRIFKSTEELEEHQKKGNNFERLVNLFLFIWFIAGCVYIYRTKDVYTSDKNSPDYCDYTLYMFAFWMNTATFILIGISWVFMCIIPACLHCFLKD